MRPLSTGREIRDQSVNMSLVIWKITQLVPGNLLIVICPLNQMVFDVWSIREANRNLSPSNKTFVFFYFKPVNEFSEISEQFRWLSTITRHATDIMCYPCEVTTSFFEFEGHQSYLGPLIPLFLISTQGFKDTVDSLTCVQWIPQIHLLWDTCWPLGSQYAAFIFHIYGQNQMLNLQKAKSADSGKESLMIIFVPQGKGKCGYLYLLLFLLHQFPIDKTSTQDLLKIFYFCAVPFVYFQVTTDEQWTWWDTACWGPVWVCSWRLGQVNLTENQSSVEDTI